VVRPAARRQESRTTTSAGRPSAPRTAVTQYTIVTFTLTALQNASLGNSNVLLRQNDGSGGVTQVIENGDAISLNPSPSNSFSEAIDLSINVQAAPTPEPATFLLMGLPLAGIALLASPRKAVVSARAGPSSIPPGDTGLLSQSNRYRLFELETQHGLRWNSYGLSRVTACAPGQRPRLAPRSRLRHPYRRPQPRQ